MITYHNKIYGQETTHSCIYTLELVSSEMYYCKFKLVHVHILL